MAAILAEGVSRRDPDKSRRQAFTTWLGLRYDRPAVPNDFVSLAQCVSKEICQNRTEMNTAVRDVLLQFGDGTPPGFSFFAVLDNSADEKKVRQWLARVANIIPIELGMADKIEPASADGIAFSVIENSYAADVSQVAWPKRQPSDW
ncbi:MAG: hypothetical protein M1374_01775 [Firmicutes bacterium]|nr:hypothetical protein [Bacillota bacterium]